MIKILFFIEELVGGGAEKVLQNLANNMDQSQFDITVQSVWPYQGEKVLAPGIRYKSLYPVKNRITAHIYRLEAAAGLAYRLHMKDNYDIECAFLEHGPTKILASSTNKKARKYAWVHCDLSRALAGYVHNSYEAFAAKTYKWWRWVTHRNGPYRAPPTTTRRFILILPRDNGPLLPTLSPC